MMEDDWFLPDVGGQPLQKFFEYHMEEAKKCAQQPSNGPQKTDHFSVQSTFNRSWIALLRFMLKNVGFS